MNRYEIVSKVQHRCTVEGLQITRDTVDAVVSAVLATLTEGISESRLFRIGNFGTFTRTSVRETKWRDATGQIRTRPEQDLVYFRPAAALKSAVNAYRSTQTVAAE